MKQKFFWLSILIVLIYSVFILNAQSKPNIIKNNNPEFKITIPENFQSFKGTEMPKGWALGYYEKTGFEDKQPITIGIEIKDEVLKKEYAIDWEKLKNDYPNDAVIKKIIFNSLGLNLQGIKVIIRSARADSVMYVVPVPVKTSSIVIIGGGIAERDSEIRRIIDDILKSLEAETNWSKNRKSNINRFLRLIFRLIRKLFYLFRRSFY